MLDSQDWSLLYKRSRYYVILVGLFSYVRNGRYVSVVFLIRQENATDIWKRVTGKRISINEELYD